jgi:hypothetical protein
MALYNSLILNTSVFVIHLLPITTVLRNELEEELPNPI